MKIKRPRYGLFIDAGFANCGAVVVDIDRWTVRAQKTLRSEARAHESQSQGYVRRSREIAYQLDKLASMHNVRFVCGELPHGGAKSARAMGYMCMATAIISVFCALRNYEFLPVTPTEIKRLVRPKGKVEKEEVEKVVLQHFGNFMPKSKKNREHVSDAAASALVARRKFSTKISEL